MREYIQVTTTTESKADAEKIAESLVEKKLAGCVQIVGPISSVYLWEGKIEKADEWLCLIKTTRALYENLESTLHKIHPYKVPEILSIPVIAGSKDYLSWLDNVLERIHKSPFSC
jgi:periplasmic divalent cation tolerance protein